MIDPTPDQVRRMRERVMTHVAASQRRRRRTASLAAVGLIGVTAMSATAWVVLAPLAVRDRQVLCYEAPSLASPHVEMALVDSDEVTDPAVTAQQNCSLAWSAALLSTGMSTADAADATADAAVTPEVALCVRADGVFVGLPQPRGIEVPELCEKLGLAAGE